jgi:hypothetical protein
MQGSNVKMENDIHLTFMREALTMVFPSLVPYHEVPSSMDANRRRPPAPFPVMKHLLDASLSIMVLLLDEE